MGCLYLGVKKGNTTYFLKTLSFFLWVLSFNFTIKAFAEGIDMSKFRLSPSIKIEERYEDNIYLTADDPKNDMVTTITPELLLEGKCGGNDKFTLDYKYEILSFSKLKEENRRTNSVEGKLELIGQKYFLKINEGYKEIACPTSYVTDFIDNSLNDAKIAFGAVGNDASYELSWEYMNFDSKEIDSDDSYNEFIMDCIGDYKILPRTQLFGRYTFADIDYPKAANNNTYNHKLLTGIKGELSPRATGTVSLGYQRWENKTTYDYNKLITNTNITYDLQKKTKLNIAITRNMEKSSYTEEKYKDQNTVSCIISQDLTGKTTVSLNTAYGYERYPSSESTAGTPRRDNLWSLRFALDTNSKRWLSLGSSYEFKSRDSNISSNDYKDNITTIYFKSSY